MKFSLWACLVTGISISQYAIANPLRVVVITGNQDIASNVRLGHPASDNNNDPALAHIVRPTFPAPSTPISEVHEAGPHRIHGGRRPCHSFMKDKALRLSELLRQVFGLSPVEAQPKAAEIPAGFVHILPFTGHMVDEGTAAPPPPPHDHHHRHHRHHCKGFFKRIHRALMSLGPWEGRAVAFVLGCGIGVLLRMLWVMTIITYRLIRGEPEEPQYIEIVCERYADDIVVSPPEYPNEKAGVEADPKKQAGEA